MKEEKDYSRDIAEIRSMMERSSKFLSLSGWAGIMAGMYALAGAYIAYSFYNFNPDEIFYSSPDLSQVIILALLVLVLALITALYSSRMKADNDGEKAWNATSRRLLASMAVPLVTGGILILILISKGLIGLIIPMTLLFYGLSLYNAGKFTIDEVKFMGMAQILLGLLSFLFIEYSLIFWAGGFGVVHMIYGMYMYIRFER
ncbi:MAG: hypothetical protein WD016_11065 [Balneolaceae bacterium]